MKESTRVKFAIASFIASIVFGLIGCFCPPVGFISSSMLIWTAQLLLFTSMLLGFSTKDNALLKEMSELIKELKEHNK